MTRPRPQLRPAARALTAATGRAIPGWARRQTSTRRAVLAALAVVLALAALSPLLLLTSWMPGSPRHLADDPTVAALLALRDPSSAPTSSPASRGLRYSTLPDGTLKASGLGRDGVCYVVLIPASADQAPSPVRPGAATDCTP